MSEISEWQNASRPGRIVWLFRRRCSEVHKNQVCRALGITANEFEQSIGVARDQGTKLGIWLTPIYDRSGWWTGYPTDRIVARACIEAGERNIGEAVRNRNVAQARAEALGTDTSKQIASGVALVEMAYMGASRSLQEQVSGVDTSGDLDYVIDRVDAAVEDGRLYVPLPAGDGS